MATMDGSPSLFAGQPWTTWAANVPLVDGNSELGYRSNIYDNFIKQLPVHLHFSPMKFVVS